MQRKQAGAAPFACRPLNTRVAASAHTLDAAVAAAPASSIMLTSKGEVQLPSAGIRATESMACRICAAKQYGKADNVQIGQKEAIGTAQHNQQAAAAILRDVLRALNERRSKSIE